MIKKPSRSRWPELVGFAALGALAALFGGACWQTNTENGSILLQRVKYL